MEKLALLHYNALQLQSLGGAAYIAQENTDGTFTLFNGNCFTASYEVLNAFLTAALYEQFYMIDGNVYADFPPDGYYTSNEAYGEIFHKY